MDRPNRIKADLALTGVKQNDIAKNLRVSRQMVCDVIAVLPPAPTPAQLWAAYQAKAQAALTKSDMVAIRCVKAGVVFHDKWLAYVQALRAIVAAPSGDAAQPLPAQPPYPAGT